MLQVVKDKVQINYDATRLMELGSQNMNINDDLQVFCDTFKGSQTNGDGDYDRQTNVEQDEFNLVGDNAMLEDKDNGFKTFLM